MTTLKINGLNLYYKEAGSGEPLLLIHGMGFNADVWDSVFDLLAQDYRVIAYDRRGYQRTEGPLAPAGAYNQHGKDIVALLQALNATPAILFGWSSGGIHALHATLECPTLVKRLTLYEPPLHATKYLDWPSISMFIRVMIFKAIGNKPAAAQVFARTELAYKDGRNSYDHLSANFKAKLAQDSSTLLTEFQRGTGEEIALETLKTGIKVPVTLLVGDQSPNQLQRITNDLAGVLQVPLVTLQDCNHLCHIDKPAEFVRVVKKILA